MSVQAPEMLWQPSPDQIERATLTRYIRWLEDERDLSFPGYDALWSWSVEQIEEFWLSIWDFFDVQADRPYERVLASREMPCAEWFPCARLNWAEHVLRPGEDCDTAILHASEKHPDLQEITRGELRELTARIATGLRRLGVGPGDRVAAYLPNIPEAIASLLACAPIGAVWSSWPPDFGARSVVDRFGQIEPKVLLAFDGYRYGGTAFNRAGVVAELRDALPSVQHVVLLPFLNRDSRIDGTISWDELVREREPLRFEPVPFEQTLRVFYSSGTTGLPKGIVHGYGGVLLEQLKHNHLHLDAQPRCVAPRGLDRDHLARHPDHLRPAQTRRSTAAGSGWEPRRSRRGPGARQDHRRNRRRSTRAGGEGWTPLFVVLAPGAELNEELIRQIAQRVREDCSPRHVPNQVFAVPGIPRTLSGKSLEVPVKRLLMGSPREQVASRDSLANPEALDWFADFATARSANQTD